VRSIISSLVGVQRDSYLESPTDDPMEGNGSLPPLALINRKVSAVLPRPAQRSDSTVSVASSPPPIDELLNPFNW